MRASFIIRAYNSAEVLPRAIESALAQDFPKNDYEIVVVDDGSIDTTFAVASKFAEDTRVRIVRQENKGIIEAGMAGIRAAEGEIFIFLDADDESMPSALSNFVAALSNPEVDYAYGHYFEEYEGNRKLVEPTDPFKAPAGAFAWRKKLVVEEGGFFGVSMFPEYEMLLKTSDTWKGKLIAEPVFIYHRSKGSLTGDPARVDSEIDKLRKRYPDKAEMIGQIRNYMLS